MADGDEWVDLGELGRAAGGYQRAWALVRSKAVIARKVGGRWLVLRSSMEAMIRRSAPIDFSRLAPRPAFLGNDGAITEYHGLICRARALILQMESQAFALELDGKHAQAELLRQEIIRSQQVDYTYDVEANCWRVELGDTNSAFALGGA